MHNALFAENKGNLFSTQNGTPSIMTHISCQSQPQADDILEHLDKLMEIRSVLP